MAGEPLDRLKDSVQYPLATPSKRCPSSAIVCAIPSRRFHGFHDKLGTVPIWDACLRLPSLGKKLFRSGRRADQLTPRDQLNVLLSQNLTELVTGKEVEVALSPGRTPRGTFPGGGA